MVSYMLLQAEPGVPGPSWWSSSECKWKRTPYLLLYTCVGFHISIYPRVRRVNTSMFWEKAIWLKATARLWAMRKNYRINLMAEQYSWFESYVMRTYVILKHWGLICRGTRLFISKTGNEADTPLYVCQDGCYFINISTEIYNTFLTVWIFV